MSKKLSLIHVLQSALHDRKLVSAKPGNDIIWTHAACQSARYGPKQLVPDKMAKAIVHWLEG